MDFRLKVGNYWTRLDTIMAVSILVLMDFRLKDLHGCVFCV